MEAQVAAFETHHEARFKSRAAPQVYLLQCSLTAASINWSTSAAFTHGSTYRLPTMVIRGASLDPHGQSVPWRSDGGNAFAIDWPWWGAPLVVCFRCRIANSRFAGRGQHSGIVGSLGVLRRPDSYLGGIALIPLHFTQSCQVGASMQRPPTTTGCRDPGPGIAAVVDSMRWRGSTACEAAGLLDVIGWAASSTRWH